jgi:uncharacterized membrane protein
VTLKKLAGIVASTALSLLFLTTPILLAESLIPIWLGLVASLVPTLVVIAVLIARTPFLGRRLLIGITAVASALLIEEFGLLKPQNVYLINFIAIYAIFFKEFYGSLHRNQVPLCTRFAMLVHESISPQLAKYTKALTYSWAAFFGLQIPIWLALFFILPTQLWSELISVVPPVLIVALFAIDLIARQLMLPYEDRKDSLLRTIKALIKHRNNLKQAVAK